MTGERELRHRTLGLREPRPEGALGDRRAERHVVLAVDREARAPHRARGRTRRRRPERRRDDRELDAIADAERAARARDRAPHRRVREPELERDLLVREAAAHERGDRPRARIEQNAQARVTRAREEVRARVDRAPRDDHQLAVHHRVPRGGAGVLVERRSGLEDVIESSPSGGGELVHARSPVQRACRPRGVERALSACCAARNAPRASPEIAPGSRVLRRRQHVAPRATVLVAHRQSEPESGMIARPARPGQRTVSAKATRPYSAPPTT